MAKKLTIEEFIAKARAIHGNKYDYSSVEYYRNKNKVEIICTHHGKFSQTPSNHMRGQGCPKCKFDALASRKRSTIEDFSRKGALLHKNKYGYSQFIYKNAFTKGKIECPFHGPFLQSPNNHLRGRGCRKCQYEMLSNITISKGQKEFISYLELSSTNIPIKNFIVDGFNPNENTIYEFLGDYWHGNPKNSTQIELIPQINSDEHLGNCIISQFRGSIL